MSVHTNIARLREASYAAPTPGENPNTCRVNRDDLRTAIHIILRLDADLHKIGSFAHGSIVERSHPATKGALKDSQFPAGSITNGRTLADRLEAYPFESEGGDLRRCSDWVEFRRCFEYLAEWASAGAPAAGDALAIEDQQYLNWMIAEECRVETLALGSGTRYRVHWPDQDEYQAEWFFSPCGAIRAAIAQQSQRKEA